MNLKESLSKVYSRRNKQVWLGLLPLALNAPTVMQVLGQPVINMVSALLLSLISIALFMGFITLWTIINNEIELRVVNKYMISQGYAVTDLYKKSYTKDGKNFTLQMVFKHPNKIDSQITELLIKEEISPTLIASL